MLDRIDDPGLANIIFDLNIILKICSLIISKYIKGASPNIILIMKIG
jgi:hypothetical protein